MTQDLASLWQRIEDEATATDPPVSVRHLVVGGASAEVHVGVSAAGHRQVWVTMPEHWNGDPAALPRWRGARLWIHTGPERPRGRTFLVLEQLDGAASDVFVTLAGYLCNALQGQANAAQVPQVLEATLAAWRDFFENDGLEGLSREAQQGLWGEMWLLREHLIPTLGLKDAVQAWTGGYRANHDFQHLGRAVEVKTTSARRHHVMRIKSERQLDTTGLKSLHVVFLTLARIDNGGETLPRMVTSVRDLVAQDAAAARRFEQELLAARYVDNHHYLYRTGFACRDAKAFEVRPGFPRITERDIPPGTGDVSYSISLDACAAYAVDFLQIRALLGASNGGNS